MSITRPTTMSQEDVNKLVKAIEERGGSITLHDPRVSQAQTWILTTFGAGILAIGAYLVNSVNELNRTMERVVVSNEYMTKIIDTHDRAVEDHARRIAILEGARK